MLTTFFQRMAVDYDYTTTYDELYAAPEVSSGALTAMWLVLLVILIPALIGMWKVFAKAGKPGWAAIVPIYNSIVLLQIAGRPLWWFVLMLIPLVNVVVLIVLCDDVAKAFGQGTGMTLLLTFLPFIAWPMLGFGSAQYTQPAAR